MRKIIYLLMYFVVFGIISSKANGKVASDIIHALSYSNQGVNFIILHEYVFHPTSSSYEQGNFRSTGYNETRISVYNANKGELIVQKSFGVLNEGNSLALLGCVDSTILIYTSCEQKGFVALDIHTLEAQTTFVNYMINRDFGNKYFKGGTESLYENFGYNPFANTLIFTDTLNKRYSCPLKEYEVSPSDYKLNLINRNGFLETYFSTPKHEFSFTRGSSPCILIDKDISKLCFYDGHFIMEQDPVKQFNYLLEAKIHLDELRDERYKKAEQYKYAKNEQYKVLLTEVDSIDKLVEQSNYRIESLLKGYSSTEILLKSNSKTCFVAHNNTIKPDGLLSISKIETEQETILFKPWTAVIPGMFYNIANASSTNTFKRYFPEGAPESNYINFRLINDNLLIIYLLHMCLIDTNTGDIIWKRRL